jgi:serine/threonine-protein phosphatase 2A regulatory subunit B'
VLEPASWPQLQVANDFSRPLRSSLIVSSELNGKAANTTRGGHDVPSTGSSSASSSSSCLTARIPRERDYLRTILHRICGKFMSYRYIICGSNGIPGGLVGRMSLNGEARYGTDSI